MVKIWTTCWAESLVWHPKYDHWNHCSSGQHQSSIVCDSGRDPGPVVVMWGYMKYFLASVTSDHNLAPVTIRWSPITPFTHSNIVIISKMSSKLLIQNKSKISEDQIWNCKNIHYHAVFVDVFSHVERNFVGKCPFLIIHEMSVKTYLITCWTSWFQCFRVMSSTVKLLVFVEVDQINQQLL